MNDRDHEVQLKLAELRIQRAKLIGVLATSLAAVATAALVIVPIFTGQRDAAAVASQPGRAVTSGVSSPSQPPSSSDDLPTLRDVCVHVMEIMKREFGEGTQAPSGDELKRFEDKCVSDLDTEKQKLGEAKFARQVRCVMAASNMDDLMKCDDK